MRALRWLTLALAVAAFGAACGSTEVERDDAQGVTAAQVIREFPTVAGRQLQRAATPDEAWEQLSYGLDPSPEVLRRYGVFSVYVVEAGNDEAVASLLRDKATGEPLAADANGIYWERDSLSGTWIAHARYGENVVLAWFSERRTRSTDARWDRLDATLNTLAR